MGNLKIKLSATLTNASALPYREEDSIISTGSLMLFEPAHPGVPSGNPALSEVPYNLGTSYAATQFPNIASRPLLTLVSQTMVDATAACTNFTLTISAISGVVNVGDEIWNAAGTAQIGIVAALGTSTGGTGTVNIVPQQTFTSQAIKIKPGIRPMIQRLGQKNGSNVEVNFKTEYTPKGGIHFASSRTTMNTAAFFGLQLPGAIRKYIYDNPTHEFYLSTWEKITAQELTGNTGPNRFIGLNSGSSSYLFQENPTTVSTENNYALAVGSRDGSNFLNTGLTVEQHSNVHRGTALSGYTSTMLAWPWVIGSPVGAFGNSYGQNKSRSSVLYRVYLEDMTVSGRTFAQVKAKDDLAYGLAFGAGGRYNGDTYTAPGTLIA